MSHVCGPSTILVPAHIIFFKGDLRQATLQDEMEAISRTWDVLDQTLNCKIIGIKCVCKTKYHSDETLNKHKAELVEKDMPGTQD